MPRNLAIENRAGEDPAELDSSPTLRNDLRRGAQGALALLKNQYS